MQLQPAVPVPWWVRAVEGVVSILFGLALIFWPGLSLTVFVYLFAIYALILGVVQLIAMFRAIGAHQTWWTHLVFGLLSLGAGIFAIAYTATTALVLLFVIAFWAIALGVMEIVGGFATGEFMLFLVGALSVVFGFILLANPVGGALALVTVIGVFAIVRGIVEIIGAFRAPAVTQPGP